MVSYNNKFNNIILITERISLFTSPFISGLLLLDYTKGFKRYLCRHLGGARSATRLWGNRTNSPPKFSKTCFVVRYNNKLQSFCPPKISVGYGPARDPFW